MHPELRRQLRSIAYFRLENGNSYDSNTWFFVLALQGEKGFADDITRFFVPEILISDNDSIPFSTNVEKSVNALPIIASQLLRKLAIHWPAPDFAFISLRGPFYA